MINYLFAKEKTGRDTSAICCWIEELTVIFYIITSFSIFASQLLSIWKSQLLFWPELGLELEFLLKKVTNDRGIIPESSKITIGVTVGKAARFANTVS